MSEYPQKEFYKLNEVCRYTDTQPYVLRFWESEFPQLKPERSGSGQPVYRKEDIDLVRRIKELLYDEDCSLEVARQELEKQPRPRSTAPVGQNTADESSEPVSASSAAGALRRDVAAAAPRPKRVVEQESVARTADPETIPRERYEDAVEQVHHLRLQLKEAEKAKAKAESSLEQASEERERYRLKAARAGDRIEQLLDGLS